MRSRRIPGAKRGGFKRIFHPKAERERLWSYDNRQKVPGVEMVDKVQHQILRKLQMAYECRIPQVLHHVQVILPQDGCQDSV